MEVSVRYLMVLIFSTMHGIVSSPVESSGFHQTPVDFDLTLSQLDSDWTLKSGLQSSGSPVDWALYQPIWPGKMGTGVHWIPYGICGGG